MTKASLEITAQTVLPQNRGLYYDGAWHNAILGRRIPVTNPADGSSLGEVDEATSEDIDRVVRAARKAQPGWRAMAPTQRAAALRQMAQVVRTHAEELALLDALDCGNPRSAMVGDMMVGAALLDYFAGLATEMKGETIPTADGQLNYVLREPLGVVARIVPFNHPAMFVCAKIAAPLVAGNSVIIKPSEQTPLSALKLAELFDGILPKGVLSIVNGQVEAGAALSEHDQVDNISLVGSIQTGIAVSRAAANTLKSTLMELGGKNAMVVFPDADLKKAAASAVHGMNFGWTAGQSCGSTSRLFLHEDIHDEVLSLIVEQTNKIQLGLPEKIETEMGCLSSKSQFDKVLDYIRVGESEGARLVSGGTRPDDPTLAKGYFIRPTVFADVTRDMRIAREEIFGPILSVLRWSSEESVLAMANELEFGLTASVWTRDLGTAHRAASALDVGYVWVNGSSAHIPGAPFGGNKKSGLGREECLQELFAFTQTKNVNVAY
jgi:betaine-aldehyde dehydrogenase